MKNRDSQILIDFRWISKYFSPKTIKCDVQQENFYAYIFFPSKVADSPDPRNLVNL